MDTVQSFDLMLRLLGLVLRQSPLHSHSVKGLVIHQALSCKSPDSAVVTLGKSHLPLSEWFGEEDRGAFVS